jgi:methylenetetrahydrofolate dehydrogenase (NADP+)/methenyltetrahydrofolate cyclohydrolase
MTAELIRGRDVAEGILRPIADWVDAATTKPGLALILVGDDPASHVYVGMKEKKCREIGYHVEKYVLDASTPEADVIALVERMNRKRDIHGILVQLPLPAPIDEQRVIDSIAPSKDVDGFTKDNLGALISGEPGFVAATAAGILELIKSTPVTIEGSHAVVIGRSNVVGKPTALLLLGENATVTLCHSRTRDLAAIARQADILVAAVGRPKLVTASMIKPGAVVIDAGTSKVDGKLVGDVDFEQAKEIAGSITPVPGGVGPMTIAMLLANTMKAMELQISV